MVAEMFGPYRLVSPLGQGGMGEVWRAVDTRKDREIALKVLGSWVAGDVDFARRFRREAALAARLNAPHIVPIHDYGEIDGRLYIEMALISGTDLETTLERTGPLPAARAVEIVGQVAHALDAAHRAGLVHRDVKPSNILISDSVRDFTYLIDFGISRAMDGSRISQSGTLLGTPAYMAPERFEGAGDPRSDVYALACVLHEALTGQRPFTAPAGAHQLGYYLNAHLHATPPRPSALNPAVPAGLDEVIVRGMAKAPDARYATAGELADAARTALAAGAVTPPVESRPQTDGDRTPTPTPPPTADHPPPDRPLPPATDRTDRVSPAAAADTADNAAGDTAFAAGDRTVGRRVARRVAGLAAALVVAVGGVLLIDYLVPDGGGGTQGSLTPGTSTTGSPTTVPVEPTGTVPSTPQDFAEVLAASLSPAVGGCSYNDNYLDTVADEYGDQPVRGPDAATAVLCDHIVVKLYTSPEQATEALHVGGTYGGSKRYTTTEPGSCFNGVGHHGEYDDGTAAGEFVCLRYPAEINPQEFVWSVPQRRVVVGCLYWDGGDSTGYRDALTRCLDARRTMWR